LLTSTILVLTRTVLQGNPGDSASVMLGKACLHCMHWQQNSSGCTLLARPLIFAFLTNQGQNCCMERPEILALSLCKAPIIIKASDWCLACDRLMTRAPWDRLNKRLQPCMSQLPHRYPTTTPPVFHQHPTTTPPHV